MLCFVASAYCKRYVSITFSTSDCQLTRHSDSHVGYDWVLIETYTDSGCTIKVEVQSYDGSVCQPTFEVTRPGGWEKYVCADADGVYNQVAATIWANDQCS